MVKRTVISQNTLVPLSLVLVLAGGIYKFVETSFAIESNKTEVDAVTADMKEMRKNIVSTLNDQNANLTELRTQFLVMDAKLNAIAETLKSMRYRSLRERGD